MHVVSNAGKKMRHPVRHVFNIDDLSGSCVLCLHLYWHCGSPRRKLPEARFQATKETTEKHDYIGRNMTTSAEMYEIRDYLAEFVIQSYCPSSKMPLHKSVNTWADVAFVRSGFIVMIKTALFQTHQYNSVSHQALNEEQKKVACHTRVSYRNSGQIQSHFLPSTKQIGRSHIDIGTSINQHTLFRIHA